MVVDYQKGKIYRIWTPQTDKIYIGSTAQHYLSSRMSRHFVDMRQYEKGKRQYCSAYELLEYPDAKIELIENYPCNSKEELKVGEGHHQRLNWDKCVNIRQEGRSPLQYQKDNPEKVSQFPSNQKDKKAQYNQEYRQNNKEQIEEHKAKWYQNNKEKIAEKAKKYREANQEAIKQRKKDYYEANKERIKQKQRDQRQAKKTQA